MFERYFDFGTRTYSNSQKVYRHMVRCDDLAPSGHEHLFSFLSNDLCIFQSDVESYTRGLLKGYIEGEPDPDEEFGIYWNAEQIHPCFRNREEARSLILKSIIEYARSIHLKENVLNALSTGSNSSAFSQEKQFWLSESGTVSNPRKGSIYSLLKTQDRISAMITTLLDDSVPVLSAMTEESRTAVYTAFFSSDEMLDGMSVTIELMPFPSSEADYLKAQAESLYGNNGKATDRLEKVLFGDLRSQWIPVLDSVRDEEAYSIIMAYKVKTLEDIFETELYDMLQKSTRIGRCKSCGRFFVIEPENADYCTIEEDGKSCLRTYREGVTKDMYWKGYKAHNQRVLRGRCTKGEFNTWKAEASAAREKVLQRSISMADYEKILKK